MSDAAARDDDVRGGDPAQSGSPARPDDPGALLAAGVGRAVRATRRQAGLAVLLTALAVVPGGLLVAWAVGRWSLRAGPLLLVMTGGLAVAAVAVALTRRWVAAVDHAAVAGAAERDRGLPDGALRGVLELGRSLPEGVSGDLLRLAEGELAGRLAGDASLAGDVGLQARRRLSRALVGTSVLTALVAVVALAFPERARAAWGPLLRPVSHLNGPALPALGVAPGDTAVDRGADAAITVRAPLRRRVTVHWRAAGEVPGSRTLAVAGDSAVSRLGPIQAETRYWVTAPDGAATDTFRLTPLDPLLLAGLDVDVIYPSHTRLDPDRYTGEMPPLRLPDGTRLRFRGRATRAVESVELVRGDDGVRTAAVEGAGFTLDWRVHPGDEGLWEWQLRDRGKAAEPAASALDLTVVADAPPEVTVIVPGVDTLMPASRTQAVVADAGDDFGVAAGALVVRRVGDPDSVVTPLPVGATAPRALLRGVLDASGLGLVPGDVVEYFVAARDNAPVPQMGRSPTYTLRLPAMGQLRDQARAEAAGALDEARRLADRSRDLETATRDLARRARTSAADPAPGQPAAEASRTEPLGYEEAAESRDLLDEHEAVLSAVEELQDRMAELEQTAAEAGLGDPDLRRRLEALRSLYDRLAPPEMRESMERLAEAVESLDPEAVRSALEALAEQQARFRDRVEESLEMLRRAAAEADMNALARDAEELAARQEALTEAARQAAADSAADRAGPADAAEERSTRQEALGDETGELASSLDSLGQRLARLGERAPADATASAGEQSQAARRSMEEAAGAARSGEAEASARSGDAASQSLRSAAGTLDEARTGMASNRSQQAQEAMGRAAREALELAGRQESLRESLAEARRRGGLTGAQEQETRSEQAALEQGLSQLGRNLVQAARSALLDREVGDALQGAGEAIGRVAQGLEASDGSVPVPQAEAGVESLNRLALALLANQGRLQQQSQDGGQQALDRLGELARQQAGLNGQVGALVPLGLSPEALARQLREMARRQQEIGQGVSEADDALGDRDDVLGDLNGLAREAEDLARELEAGRLDPEVRARQERLFHRLLDAGRSLQRDEYGRERVAERARPVAAEDPGPLDPSLLDAGLRYPVPTPDQLRGLPPAYRALVLEYFDRLNRGVGGSGGDHGGDSGTGSAGSSPGGTGGGS